MPSAHLSKPLFIGQISFQLSSSNLELLQCTEAVFVTAPGQPEPCRLIDLDSPFELNGATVASRDPRMAILRVKKTAFDAHCDLLFADGSAITLADGRLILLFGASWSGKSTLTVAGVLRDGWKVVSEDMVFFDHGRIVPFDMPVSLRPGSQELIKATCGIFPSILYDKWYVNPQIFVRPHSNNPVATVVLDKLEESVALQAKLVSRGDVIRRLFPWSNLLLFDDGPDFFWHSLPADNCWVFSGGGLAERLDQIKSLTQAHSI